jgi:hypothetical protein
MPAAGAGMRQHDLVACRLAAAPEGARPAGGPCYRIGSVVAVRFADAADSPADHRPGWPGRRYMAQAARRRALTLDDPARLTVTFEELQRP